MEDEKFGLEHLKKNHGHECWVQYSQHTHCNTHAQGRTPLRGNSPDVGWTYDSTKDVFIPPESQKPASSWIWDDDICWWKAPIDMPSYDTFTDEEKNGTINEDGSWKVRPYYWQWSESKQEWTKTNVAYNYLDSDK